VKKLSTNYSRNCY